MTSSRTNGAFGSTRMAAVERVGMVFPLSRVFRYENRMASFQASGSRRLINARVVCAHWPAGLDALLLERRGEGGRALRRPHAIRRWCPDDRQRAHTLRTTRGEGPRDGPANLGPHQMEARHTQCIHEAAEIVDEDIERPREIS